MSGPITGGTKKVGFCSATEDTRVLPSGSASNAISVRPDAKLPSSGTMVATMRPSSVSSMRSMKSMSKQNIITQCFSSIWRFRERSSKRVSTRLKTMSSLRRASTS